MRRTLLVCAMVLVLPLTGRAAGAPEPTETVVRMSVRPTAPPKPALKYQLLPELREMNPGNPIQAYSKCFAEQYNFWRNKEAVEKLQVRNARGDMVPLGTVMAIKDATGPVLMMRYNMYPAAAINGSPAPGTSSGQALAQMQAVVTQQLPPSMRTEWTELALLQLQTGNTAMWAFLLAVVLVFLVLAAQYESWSLPLAVILVVPMCLLCSITGVVLAKMDVNIFTQIGFLVLVGLACKNAILIVEFAKAQRETGMSRHEATLAACRLRLRPIIMTSFAFILGVVPRMVSEGAGAGMRRTLGIAVFAGMLGVTLFGVFLTPVFYYVIQWFKDRQESAKPEMAEEVVAVGQMGATQHAG